MRRNSMMSFLRFSSFGKKAALLHSDKTLAQWIGNTTDKKHQENRETWNLPPPSSSRATWRSIPPSSPSPFCSWVYSYRSRHGVCCRFPFSLLHRFGNHRDDDGMRNFNVIQWIRNPKSQHNQDEDSHHHHPSSIALREWIIIIKPMAAVCGPCPRLVSSG